MGMMDMLRKADAYLSEPLEDGQPRSLIYSGLKDSVANLGEIAKQFNDGNGYMVGGTVVPVDPQRISQAVMDWGAVASPVGGMMTPAGSLGVFGGKMAKNAEPYLEDYAKAYGGGFGDILAAFRAKESQPEHLMEWYEKGRKLNKIFEENGGDGRIWEDLIYNGTVDVDYPDLFQKPLSNKFFSDGIKGKPAPYRTLGFRFGDLPERVSFNHATGNPEAGISVMGTLDERLSDFRNDVDIYKMLNQFDARPAYLLEGFKPWNWGSDGEPLLLEGAKIVGNIKDTGPIYRSQTIAPTPIQVMQHGDTSSDTQPLVYGRDFI